LSSFVKKCKTGLIRLMQSKVTLRSQVIADSGKRCENKATGPQTPANAKLRLHDEEISQAHPGYNEYGAIRV
jgi:hypothetical protein